VFLVIRSTTKRVRVMYILCLTAFLLLAAAVYYHPPYHHWALLLILIPLGINIKHHLLVRLTSLTVDEHFLRYQSGFLSKTTRTVEAHKVQDVRVDQNLFQRILRTGDLSIETAGSSSRLAIADIDCPHEIAAQILKLSSKGLPNP